MDPCRRDGLFGSLAVGDVAPRADDLVRLAALVMDQAQFVADPAIVAVLLQEPVLEGVVALLEQLPELALHPPEIIRVHTVAPEVGAVEIIARLVAQPLLDVLTDEGRPKISRCLEAVNYRRRGREELCETRSRCRFLPLGILERTYVTPGTDHFERFALIVSDELLVVLDPAIGIVLPAKAIFQGVEAGFECERDLRLHPVEVIGMNAVSPKFWIFEIVGRRVSEESLDIGAHECGAERACRLETVDDAGRSAEQPHHTSADFGLYRRFELPCGWKR